MGSYAVALNMPFHRYREEEGARRCSVCGEYKASEPLDVNVLNFERHKWGGVRHDYPGYIAFDLERFKAEQKQGVEKAARTALVSLLATIDRMPLGAKLVDLVRALRPYVGGNADQRRILIGILCFAGVAKVPDRVGFFRSFPKLREREETPWYKDDWPYPARWWRGGDGVDQRAVEFWFGDLRSDA